LILRFFFTMVLGRYFMPFLPLPWPMNNNHASRCTKSSTHSSPSWFWSNFFSFPWIHGITHDHVLWALNHTNEWRTTLKVIPRFDIDPTPSWWRSQIMKDAPLSSSWTPSSLVISHFLVPWWFCYRSTPLLVMKLKLFMRVFTKLKTPPSLHGF
jgi:hypothetical protein